MCYGPKSRVDVLPPLTNVVSTPDDFTLHAKINGTNSGCLEHWPLSLPLMATCSDSEWLTSAYVRSIVARDFPGRMSLPPTPPVQAPYMPVPHLPIEPMRWGGNVCFSVSPRGDSDRLHAYTYRTAFKPYVGEACNEHTELADAGIDVQLAMMSNGSIHPVLQRM